MPKRSNFLEKQLTRVRSLDKQPYAPLSTWRRKWRESKNQHWVEQIAKPMANWINRRCLEEKAEVRVFGPFGIAARVTFEFVIRSSRPRLDGKFNADVYRITIQPFHEGEMIHFAQTLWGIKNPDAAEFPEGSIGELNSLGTATQPLPLRPTPEWFIKNLSAERVTIDPERPDDY